MKLWQTAILVWLMISGTALAQQGTRNFSVTTYGAVADDGNSDTTAIQKAIEAAEDYAAANNTRATVFFPKGSYHITWLEIDRPNITLDGYDVRLEALSGSGFNQILLVTGAVDSETAEYIVIKGLTIDGNYPTINNAGTGLGVNIRANNVKLLDVTVEATENDTFTSQYCQYVTFERCVSRDAGETGYRIRSDYTNLLQCEAYDWNAVNSASGNRAILADSLEYDSEELVIEDFKAELNEVRNSAQVMLIDAGDGTATAAGTSAFANSGVATNNAGRASWKLDVGHGFKPGDGILVSGTGQSAYDDISHRIYSIDGDCYVGVVDANTFKLYDTAANAVTNGSTGRYDITGTGTGDFYVKSPGSLRKSFTVADQSADTFTCTAHGFKTGMPARLTTGTSSHVLPAGLTGVATVTVTTAYAAAGTSGDYIRPKRINNVTLDGMQILFQSANVVDSNAIKINNVNNLAISRLRVRQTPATLAGDSSSLHFGGNNRKITIDDSVLPGGISNNVLSWIPELTITNSEIGTDNQYPTDTLKNLQVGKLTLDGNTIRFSNAAIETADSSTAWREDDVDQWKIINNIFEGKSATSQSVICLRINNDNSNFISTGKLVWYNNIRRNASYAGLTFTAATTDIISATGHALVTGDRVTVSTSGTLPTGLSANTPYFVRRTGDGVLTLHTTSTGASDNTARVDITGTGSGTHKLLGESVGCLFTGTASGGHYFGTDYRTRMFLQRGVSGREFEAATVPSNATVAYTKGDIIWQMNPIPGGSLGWLCTKTGVPGSSAGEFQAMPGTPKTYNVVNYGARPDDAIEDTTAIQAAIDAAEADAPAIVYFPPGDYESVRVVLDDDDVTIIAYGAVLNQYASLGVTDGACMLRITGDRNRVYGLEINGGGQNTAQFASASANRGIQINGGEHNFVKDCYVHDTSKYLDGTLSPGSGTGQLDHEDNVSQGADCFQVVLGNYNAFVNCISANSGWNAFRSSGNGNRFEGCHGTNYLGNGIRFNSGESGLVTSCVLTVDGISTRSGILVDPEVGDLFGSIVIRDTRVYLNSADGALNSPNVLKIARTRYCVIDGGDYEIGPDNADDDQGIRLEDTIEQCVIQNLRTDAILMTNTLFQGLTTSHASAASGTQTTITVDATSLNADTDLDEVSELLSDGKTVFISGCSIPAYNGMHDVDTANVDLGAVTFTIDTPYVAGTWGTAIAHNTTDRLTVRNVQFGHGVHNTIGPMEHIKGRIVEIEECEFDLRDNDSDDSTGSVTGIEWSVPDDRSFTLFRLVNNKARFYKNGGANGKLLDMEERTTTLLTSGKTIGYGNIVEAGVTGAGTPLVVVTTGNANRLMLFTTRGENTRSFAGTAAPTAGTWSAGDLVFNTGGSSQGALFWRCASAGTPGTWEAITPTIRGMLDANLGSITNGQGIAWNSSTNKFDPVTISGGTAVTTPDGLTTATTTDEYNVKHYNASGSGTNYFGTTSTSGTTTVTTKDSSGSATTHDFVTGQGIAVLGAGPVCAVSAPSTTVSGTASTYGSAQGTAYTWTYVDATDVITVNSAPPVTANGAPVRVTTDGVLPTGISAGTTYYLRIASATTFTFHTSSAGAIANTGLVTLTGGSGTHTIVGYTEYRYTARAGDGSGGWSAASTEVSIFNWEMTGANKNYNKLRFHVPSSSYSMAIYGRGTSSRKLMTIMEAAAILQSDETGSDDVDQQAFSAPTDIGSSTLRVTVGISHHYVANDVVYMNWLTAFDAYDGQLVIASVTNKDSDEDYITFAAGTYNSGMSGGSGQLEGSFVEWRDYGDTVPLQYNTYLPDRENMNLDWAASRKYPRGNIVLDSAGNRLFRHYASVPDSETGASEPTWPSTANGVVNDNDITWRREVPFCPINDTDGAFRQFVLTTVASTPTSSTLTLTDAVSSDISSNTLAIMHNDALAIRSARSAIVTAGKGGTLYFPAGTYNLVLPLWNNSSYWSNMLTGGQPSYVFLPLTNDASTRSPVGIGVRADRAAHVRALMSTGHMRADSMYGSITTIPETFIVGFGMHRCFIDGGTWTWDWFNAGMSEHDTDSSYSGGGRFLYIGNGNGVSVHVDPYDYEIAGARIDFPVFMTGNGITLNDNTVTGKSLIKDTWIFYGGGNGSQVGIPPGDFEFSGGGIELCRRIGSHGMYLNIKRHRFNLHDFTMRFVGTPGNNAISMRGASGDYPTVTTRLDNIVFDRCTGPVRFGDSSSSNRVINVTCSNLQGASIALAECRNVTITGGNISGITAYEDVSGLVISSLTAGSIDLTPTDRIDNTIITGVKLTGMLSMANVYGLEVDNLQLKNPVSGDLTLVSGLYEWEETSTNREYYLRLRATDGDPGISSPSMVNIRNKVSSLTAGTAGALSSSGDWTYGDPDSSGPINYNTLIVHMGDTNSDGEEDPDGWPLGQVSTGTMTATTIGVRFAGTVHGANFNNVRIESDWTDRTPLLSGANGISLKDITFSNLFVAQAGLPSTQTARLVDFGSTSMALCENVKFLDSTFKQLPTAANSIIRYTFRGTLGRGGDLTFARCKFPTWNLGWEVSSAYGNIHMIDNEIGTNEVLMTADGSTDLMTFVSTYPDLCDADGTPVLLFPGSTVSSLPTGLSVGTVYYLENETNAEIFTTAAGAIADDDALDVDFGSITSNGPIIVRFPNAARTALHSGYTFDGDGTYPDALGKVSGNTWRGSKSATYVLSADQNDYQLVPVLDEHRFVNAAARTITGFNAPALGTQGRKISVVNASSYILTLANSSSSSSAENRIVTGTGNNLAIGPNQAISMTYDNISRNWVVSGASGSMFDIVKYGATPNDATDDTTAIQAAVDAAESYTSSNPGTTAEVIVPSGVYFVGSGISAGSGAIEFGDTGISEYVTMRGTGCLKMTSTSNADAVMTVSGNHCVVEGIVFDGNGSNTPPGRGEALRVNGSYNRIVNVTGQNTKTTGSTGFTLLVQGDANVFTGFKSLNSGYSGVSNRGDYSTYRDLSIIEYLEHGFSQAGGNKNELTVDGVYSSSSVSTQACFLVDPSYTTDSSKTGYKLKNLNLSNAKFIGGESMNNGMKLARIDHVRMSNVTVQHTSDSYSSLKLAESIGKIEIRDSYFARDINQDPSPTDATGTFDTAAVVNSGGFAQLAIASHDIKTGDYIVITGTTNYNGLHLVTAANSTTITTNWRYVAESLSGATFYSVIGEMNLENIIFGDRSTRTFTGNMNGLRLFRFSGKRLWCRGYTNYAIGLDSSLETAGVFDRIEIDGLDGESLDNSTSPYVLAWDTTQGDRVLNSDIVSMKNVTVLDNGSTTTSGVTGTDVKFQTLTTNTTLTGQDSGKVFLVNAADLVITLPLSDNTSSVTARGVGSGVSYTFVLSSGGLSAGTGLQLSPNSSDKIMGNGFTSSNNKDAILSGAGDREGDAITIVSDGNDGWHIVSVIGTWTREP